MISLIIVVYTLYPNLNNICAALGHVNFGIVHMPHETHAHRRKFLNEKLLVIRERCNYNINYE